MLLQTKQLAEEIISHIRDVAGGDALVAAFTAAKKAVSAVRSERKRRAAVQVGLLLSFLAPHNVFSRHLLLVRHRRWHSHATRAAMPLAAAALILNAQEDTGAGVFLWSYPCAVIEQWLKLACRSWLIQRLLHEASCTNKRDALLVARGKWRRCKGAVVLV